MAFKPFDYFRKRQKFILAALAIMAMFLFIVGDALTGRRSGGKSMLSGVGKVFGYGDHVAVVQGHALDVETLQTLAQQRLAAFLLASAVKNKGLVGAYERANIKFTDLQRLAGIMQQRGARADIQDPQGMAGELGKPTMQFGLSEQERKFVAEMREKLGNTALTEGLTAQRSALSAPNQYFQYTGTPFGQNPTFTTPEGLVEFVFWQKKADELGVVMSSSKVTDDLIKLGAKAMTEDEITTLAARMKLKIDPGTTIKALGEELRVMIARAAFMGSVRGGGDMFAFLGQSATDLINEPTPLDLWDAYSKVKTRLEVAALTVPVNYKDFLAKVPEPTKEELTKYYDTYKKQEPDPAREAPGFKVPRMYKVDFLYGEIRENNDTAKFYDTWNNVQDMLPAVFFRSLGDFLTPPRMLVEAADKYRISQYFFREEDPFVLVKTGTKPGDTAYFRAPVPQLLEPWPTSENVERQLAARYAVVAGLAAAAPYSPIPLAAVQQLGKISGGKVPRSQVESLEAASLAANMSQGLAGLLAYPPRLGATVKYRTFKEVQSGLVDEINEERRSRLMEADLLQLKADLDEYARSDEYRKKLNEWKTAKNRAEKAGEPLPAFEPPPMPSQEHREKYKAWKLTKAESDRAKKETPKFEPPPAGEKESQKPVPLATYLERYAKPRGLLLTGMKEPRPKNELFTEKGDTPMGTLLKPVFLRAQRSEEMILDNLTAQKGLFEAGEISAPNPKPREFALYWRSLETDPRVPPFAEVEAKVKEAWKLEKARSLAEQAAMAIANDKEVKGVPDGNRKLIDNKDFKDSYTEKHISRYELSDPLRRDSATYTLAKPPGNFEYPPDDLIDKAIAELQKPGDTFVIANKPKSNYYVLFLINREQPKSNEELWIRQFDQEVVYPDAAKQLQVNFTPLSRWVAQEEARQFNETWSKYVKAATKFDPEQASRLKSFLDNLGRGGGGEDS